MLSDAEGRAIAALIVKMLRHYDHRRLDNSVVPKLRWSSSLYSCFFSAVSTGQHGTSVASKPDDAFLTR